MDKVRFPENLKELRVQKKLTQKQLSEIFGVDQRTISAWEKQVSEPSYSMLISIAQFFGVTTDFLLGITDY